MSDSQVPGFLDTYGQIKKGATAGREMIGIVGLIIKSILGLMRVALWLAFAAAWWIAMLTRTRHGLQSLFVFGLPALLTLTFLANAVGDGGGMQVMAYWWAVLIFAWLLHVILAVVRVFMPSAEHVHRMSGGEPLRFLLRLWWRISYRLRLPFVVVVLLGESLLLSMVAVIAALADSQWPPSNEPAVTAYAIPILAIPGLIALQLVSATTSAWRVSTLKDQESEQIDLSESLAKHPTKPTERAVEGVAEIPQ